MMDMISKNEELYDNAYQLINHTDILFNQIAPNFYQYLNESYRIGNFKSLNKQVNDWKPDKNDSNYLNLDFQITNSSKNSIL